MRTPLAVLWLLLAACAGPPAAPEVPVVGAEGPLRVADPTGAVETPLTVGFGAEAAARTLVMVLDADDCVFVEPVQRWVVDTLDGTRATLRLADVVTTTRPC